MPLPNIIHNFIRKPFPLIENELTILLVEQARSRQDEYVLPVAARWSVSNPYGKEVTYLEAPGFDPLAHFYEEHGLTPIPASELIAFAAINKLKRALDMLGSVRPVLDDVLKLVRSIQILKSEDEEIDVSYSHPGIAFSIFVSLCKDESQLSDLRVAESILHEAMHLKLTLIEKIVPLVKADTGNRYYSPWREELRPARGVLHGIFVFRAILDFFRRLEVPKSGGIAGHLRFRADQIIGELGQLEGFHTCPDLTADGATLTKNLLPSN